MLGKNAQIVIGIAIVIISAAFLLVGIYFANMQGLFFQNGANSLQLFANNLAAVKNALYMAPSSLSITLSGNNSLCTWDPSTDAYNCGGGSKIYNVSYASGPTLDVGTNTFSVALCFMLTVGPPGPKAASAADEASAEVDSLSEAAISAENDFGEEALATTIYKRTYRSARLAFNEQFGPEREAQAMEGLDALFNRADNPSLTAQAKRFIQQKSDVFNGIITPTSYSELVLSYLGKAYSNIKKVQDIYNTYRNANFLTKLGANIGQIGLVFWLSAGAPGSSVVTNPFSTVYNVITNGFSVAGNTIGGIPSNAQVQANTVAASYDTGAPIASQDAAINLQLQQYTTLASSAGDFASSQTVNPQTYNAIQLVIGNANLQQQIFSQLGQYAANQPAVGAYNTPSAGVGTPASLSADNSFIGNVKFNGAGDPLLSSVGFLARKSLLVYAQTASCLGSMPQGISLNNILSKGLQAYGEITSPVDFYNKLNVVTNIGTYFVGYGGELYVNGQSNGIPTLSGAPIITDLSDLCSIATTTPDVNGNLATLVFPAGNGDISFSLTQGMYNTMCSSLSALYPKTISDMVNQMLTDKQNTFTVSILVPSQFSVSLSNSTGSSKICLNRMLLDGNGNPFSEIAPSGNGLGQGYLTEYGLTMSCINVTNLTNGHENLIFGERAFNLGSNINKNSFLFNDPSQVGFSIPPGDYPNQLTINPQESSTFQSTSNFIGGPSPTVKQSMGVDSPSVNFMVSLLGKNWQSKLQGALNSLQVSGQNALGSYIVSALLNDAGNNALSYYPTDYANVTFTVVKTIAADGVSDFNITSVSDSLLFGIYPNNYNSLGGTYVSNSLSNTNLFGFTPILKVLSGG